jgi:hypothetical protein
LEGKERALHWGDSWREIEVSSLSIGFTNLETVFENAIDDTANTVGGLNYVRNVLLLEGGFSLLGEGDMCGQQGELLLFLSDCDLTIGSKISSELSLSFVVSLIEEVNDMRQVFLELFSKDFLFQRNESACNLNWLGKRTSCHQLGLCLFHVTFKIKGRAVRVTGDLNPSIGGFNLSIPTIVGVVSLFFLAMLSESNGLSLDTNAEQKFVSPRNKVSHSLILEDTFLKVFFYGKLVISIQQAGLLILSRENGKL